MRKVGDYMRPINGIARFGDWRSHRNRAFSSSNARTQQRKRSFSTTSQATSTAGRHALS